MIIYKVAIRIIIDHEYKFNGKVLIIKLRSNNDLFLNKMRKKFKIINNDAQFSND